MSDRIAMLLALSTAGAEALGETAVPAAPSATAAPHPEPGPAPAAVEEKPALFYGPI